MTSDLAHLSFAELREITDSANLPTLLMLIYRDTGDSKCLEPPYRPTCSRGLSDHDAGGFSEQIQDEIRLAGAHALFGLQSGEEPAIPMPDADQTSRMLGVCVGESVDPSYGVMFSEKFERRMGVQEDVNIAQHLLQGFTSWSSVPASPGSSPRSGRGRWAFPIPKSPSVRYSPLPTPREPNSVARNAFPVRNSPTGTSGEPPLGIIE